MALRTVFTCGASITSELWVLWSISMCLRKDVRCAQGATESEKTKTKLGFSHFDLYSQPAHGHILEIVTSRCDTHLTSF